MSKTIALQRVEAAAARHKIRTRRIKQAVDLKEKGYSNVRIGREMSVSESTVRRMLKKAEEFTALAKFMESTIRESRDEIIKTVVKSDEFVAVFGKGFGETFVLRVIPESTDVVFNAVTFEMGFDLRFGTKIKQP